LIIRDTARVTIGLSRVKISCNQGTTFLSGFSIRVLLHQQFAGNKRYSCVMIHYQIYVSNLFICYPVQSQLNQLNHEPNVSPVWSPAPTFKTFLFLFFIIH